MRRAALVLLLLIASFQGCKCEKGSAPAPPAPASAAAESPKRQRSVGLSPLRASAPVVELPVPEYSTASVAVPRGATDSRPVVIVLHGDVGDPAALCAVWSQAAPYAFVVCPRGVQQKSDGGASIFGFRDVSTTALEMRASLRALRAQFNDYVSPGPVVLGGSGNGADLAALISRQEPAYFQHLVLVDGGAAGWSSGVATIYARGGKRVLFVCTSASCRKDAMSAAVLSQRAGIEGRLVPDDADSAASAVKLPELLATSWKWLVDGDATWLPPQPANKPSTPSTSASSFTGSPPIAPR